MDKLKIALAIFLTLFYLTPAASGLTQEEIMEKKDLIEHSPVRLFDTATNAGLKAGGMGLITAKKGLGKTSILVQFGIDTLLNDKGLVHVSFDQQSSNVISWYSSVLAEIAKKKNFITMTEITDEIVKNRIVLNFNQETFNLPKVVNTVKSLKDGGTSIDSLIVDGLNFDKVSASDLKAFADYVKSNKMTAWFSGDSEATNLKETMAADKLDLFTTVAHLASEGKDLTLTVLKNGDGKVKIDAKTMLMSK